MFLDYSSLLDKLANFTKKEKLVLNLMLNGMTTNDIAKKLQIQRRSVQDHHLNSIYKKLGVKQRHKAIACIFRYLITNEARKHGKGETPNLYIIGSVGIREKEKMQ